MKTPLMLIKAEKIRTLQEEHRKTLEANATATAFIKEIEHGNLDAEFKVNGSKEEELTTALLAMQKQLQKITREEKERNWITQGLAQFVEILRSGDDNVDQYYQKIISSLVKYIGANQGGFFVVDDEDESNIKISLLASYAYERQKHLKKQLIPGEGLVGQCYLEKEIIQMTDIPQDYIAITSGLGTANPAHLIIVPLKVHNEVQGIIELASFRKLLPHEIGLLEKLSENVASSLSSLKVSERTRKLLEETQAQAEQMRAQEEELRQNMEELGATQEEMSRVGAEMEGQLSAIDKTMATIEFDLNGHILTANKNFLKLLEYNLEQIEGKHHRIFVDDLEKQSDAYKQFWQGLSQGENVIGEFKRITKSGNEIFIKGIYNPIFDKEGKPKKILKIAYDITESKAMENQIKQQLEETQAQEEELRQNMEELSATQEEMARVSAEMESQLSGIDKSLATITFDLKGNILSANNNFLQLMGYEKEEVQGKHHRIFVEKSESQSSAYSHFWKQLASGESEIGEFKRITKSGKEVHIKGIYNPILDQRGNPQRIFKIAYDITEAKEMEELLKITK